MQLQFTAGQAIKRAQSQVGEYGLPQKWLEWAHRPVKVPEVYEPNDCCWFATWVAGFRPHDVPDSDIRLGSIKALRAYVDWKEVGFPAGGRCLTPHELAALHPQPGWLALFNWGDHKLPDHVGVLEQFAGGICHTIEGNTGPAVGQLNPCGVHRRTRGASVIQGFLIPPYAHAVAKPVTTAPKHAAPSGPKHAVTGYIVQHGDTLSSIAAAHHVSLDAIKQANPAVKGPEFKIRPEQLIAIP